MNGIIKNEFLSYKCNTAEELQVLVDEYIKTYNRKRPHTLAKDIKHPIAITKKPEA